MRTEGGEVEVEVEANHTHVTGVLLFHMSCGMCHVRIAHEARLYSVL